VNKRGKRVTRCKDLYPTLKRKDTPQGVKRELEERTTEKPSSLSNEVKESFGGERVGVRGN